MSIIDRKPTKDFYYEVGEGNVPSKGFIHKFGRNPVINTADGFEAIWNGGGDYTGHNATVAQPIEVLSTEAADAGALVSSGTVTTTSTTQLIDSAATFISDGVAIGDVILDDTALVHGVVTAVTSETVLDVIRFDAQEGFLFGTASIGDAYRVATATSTGAAVVHLAFLLDGNLDNQTEEFVILNGLTGVDTVGEYMRNSRATILIAGSGGGNAGSITGRQKTTTANIFFVMAPGYNRTMIAAYTLPLGFEGHILSFFATLAGKTQANCNIRLMARHAGEVWTVMEEIAISGAGSSYVLREYNVPKNSLSPGADVKIMGDTDTNATALAGGFDIILSKS